MSGAEVVAVVSVAASVITLVEFMAKVCSRLRQSMQNDYLHDLGNRLELMGLDLDKLKPLQFDPQNGKSLETHHDLNAGERLFGLP